MAKLGDPLQIPEPEYYNDIKENLENRNNKYTAGLISNQAFFKTISSYDVLEQFQTFRNNLSIIAEYLNYHNLKIMSGLTVKEVKSNDNSEILLHNIIDYDNISVVDDSEI